MPILWVGFVFVIRSQPRPESAARLKMREKILLWAIIFAVLSIIISIVVGIFDGLGKSPYNRSLVGILQNLVMIGPPLVMREFLRSYLVGNSNKKENYSMFLLLSLFFTFCAYPFSKYTNLGGIKESVQFIAQYIAPEVSCNLLITYLSYLGGVAPSMVYVAIIQAFHWGSPVLPNFKWITTALVGILVPLFSMMAIQSYYIKESKSVKRKEFNKEKPGEWIMLSLVSIGIIWFVAGVFPIYPSVIITGSMEPVIYPGDVVLVKKNVELSELEIGNIIQFKRENILISHRICEIVQGESGTEYRTKGDNNSSIDSQNVKPEQIKGNIIQVVPKIGWPTLLLKSRDNVPLDEIEF